MSERGALLINSVIGDHENPYFDILKNVLEEMGVQVHPMIFAELLRPEVQARIIQEYPMIIISGNKGYGPHFADAEEFPQAYSWVPQYNGKLLGICRGHQIIGVSFGATLERGKHPEAGPVKVKFRHNDPISAGMGVSVSLWEEHRDAITTPEGFSHMAESASCPVQMIKGPGKQFGSQGHPEILDESKIFLFNFLNLP